MYLFRLLSLFALAASLGAGCSSRDILGDTDLPTGMDVKPVKLLVEPAVLRLGLRETGRVTVRVLYLDDTPAEGREVTFLLAGAPGGCALLAGGVVSGPEGYASNEVLAGPDRATFQVVASTLNAEDVSTTVNVGGVYVGDLRVRFQYSDLVAIGQITARLHEGAFDCPAVDLTEPPPALSTQMAGGPASSVTFADLEEEKVFSITASAIGPTGDVAATGCAVAPPIIGRDSVSVVVSLGLSPARVEGVYDFGLELHTHEALAGEAGQVVDDLNNLFLDPADVLADELVAMLADLTGIDLGTLEGTLSAAWVFVALDEGLDPDLDGDGEFVDDAITNLLLDDAPDWFYDGLTVGGDVTELMKNMTVGGRLQITAVDEAGTLQGHWDWSEILFLWRLGQGCDLADTCCGRHRYSGTEVGLAPIGSDLDGFVSERSTAGTIEYDLTLSEHRMDVQYGSIMLFVLNRLVLPGLTGEQNVRNALESLFGCVPGANPGGPDLCGCDRVGAWLDDATGSSGLGVAACELALEAASAQVEETLLDLTWAGTDSSYFTVSGSGTIEDADLDLQMDAITAGVVGGLVLDGEPSSFTGEMTGDLERMACATDGACPAGDTCQIELDVLDHCAARQVCKRAIGDRVAGQSCTTGSQCAAGRCLETRQCLGTCEQDLDCPGNLSCGIGAATVELDGDVSATINACGI
jgi:hypothetical protein